MNKKYFLFIILFMGAMAVAGCATSTGPAGSETSRLPLNEGVKDLSFLSTGEADILETINQIRGAQTAAGPLQPLKASRGLSLASKERAEELARTNRPAETKEEGRLRLFERVRKFGAFKGGVAEIASYGFYGGSAVTEIMRKDSTVNERPPLYFMDAKYTVMGVGCVWAGFPPPICVITFAGEFEEAR